MKNLVFAVILACFFPILADGMGNDSVTVHPHYNVIKFNPTPMLLWDNMRNITLSYERSLKENQSIALQAGYLELLPVFGDTVIGLVTTDRKSRYGVNVALDYRFYLNKLNRFNAPRGLYIGPYLSYYGFKFINRVEILDTDPVRAGNVSAGFNYINLGFELGYQFIFWKHLSVDLLVFGPSLTCTVNRMKFDDALKDEDRQEIREAIMDKVREKYPYLAPSLDINGNETTVAFKTFFRYSISIGYCF